MTITFLDGAKPVTDEDWPTLIPLDGCNRPSLPSMNPDMLPAWAGELARALAESTAMPPELAIGMVLATASTATARCLRIRVKADHTEPCVLWTLVALPSGSRKSAVQSAAVEPLMCWEREQSESVVPEIARVSSERKTMEARAREFRSKAAKEKNATQSQQFADEAARLEANLPEIPREPRLWTSDSTPEQLGSLLAEHGERMAWLSSEGGIFDMLQGRYSKGALNLDLILKAHSGDSDRVDRRSQPTVHLSQPLLTIGLSPQPDVLLGLARLPGFRGRGLLARFLYLMPPDLVGSRSLDTPPLPDSVKTNYHAGVTAMLNWPLPTDGGTYVLECTGAALTEWRDFWYVIEHRMRPEGDLYPVRDWGSKAPGAAARIAGVLHGIRHAHGRPWEVPISGDTMKAALELMHAFVEHSAAALGLMGSDPKLEDAREVWGWIQRGQNGRFQARDVFQGLKTSLQTMAPVNAALMLLEERGYLQVMESPPSDGPGRPPSPVVVVRPSLRESWR